MRVAIVSNTSWYLFNFRMNLMRSLLAAGHTVVAVAPEDDYSVRLQDVGIVFQPVGISGAGVNPIREAASVLGLVAVFRKHQVDVILSFTPKGNLYSAMAGILSRRLFVPNVSGLGRAFTERSTATRIARLLYRLTFPRANHVFFQNVEDMHAFIASGLVLKSRATRLPGSGVDLNRFYPSDQVDSESQDAPIFLLVARMLWDKGIGEFVQAARSVRALYPKARFQMLGFLGVENPSAVSTRQMEDWEAEGIIEFLGSTDDVRSRLAEASCVVLPSYYREGVPRALLEAAAMAKVIVTTDMPGCRDTVIDGVTGYLCRARDVDDLTQKLLAFTAQPLEIRRSMGMRGRRHIEANFSEEVVLQSYLHCLTSLSGTDTSL